MNHVHDVRTPKKQKNYQDWELKVIKAVDGAGVTADDLMHVIKRSRQSIQKKAAMMGSSLRGVK